MLLSEKLDNPGEHPLLIEGDAGTIEMILTVPDEAKKDTLALLGHPHSLQGGTMNNKVITTLARIFKELSIPCIRFNFRGVGQSAGHYDAGIGQARS